MAKGIPVNVEGRVSVVAKVFATPYIEVRGIATGAVYASGEAMGIEFFFPVPKVGVIETAIMLDRDGEAITTELWLFRGDIVATADNSAFAPSDADLMMLEMVISITNFANVGSNSVGINNGLSLAYTAPLGKLWCQVVTRGAPNIAAGNIPRFALRGLSYEE